MSDDNKVQVVFGVKLDELNSGLDAAKTAVKRDTEAMRESMDKAGKGGASAMSSAFGGIGATVRGTMEGASVDISKLGSTASQAASEMARGFSALPGVLGAVGTAALALGAAVVGLLALKGAADAASEYTEEAMKLGRGMGVSTTAASVWMAAMADVGASTGELQAASSGLTRKLKENEADMNRLGLVTRGSKGELLGMDEIMRSAISTVNSYKEGTDRNMAATAVFGRGVAGNSKLLLANTGVMEQNEAYMRELGSTVGVESVQAWEAYDTAMDRVSLGMTALQNTIGNAVMPVLGKLGMWLSDMLPFAVTVARGALGGLMSAFWALKNGVVIVWETINAMVATVAEPIRALAEAIYRVTQGDFEGAKSSLADIGKNISATWGAAMDEMVKSSEESSTRIVALFNNTDSAAPDGTGRKFTGKPAKEKKQGHEKSEMSTWDAENNAAKSTYELENNLRQRSLAEDVAFWMNKAHNVEASEADKIKAFAKGRQAEIALMKKTASEQKSLDDEQITSHEKRSLDELAMLKVQADEKLSLGQITQAQMLEIEQQLEDQRFAILQAAQKDRQTLIEQDPNSTAAALQKERNKMLDIERAHVLKLAEIRKAVAIESAKYEMDFFKGIETGFTSMFQKLLQGTMTMKGAMTSAFQLIGNSLSQVASKMAMDWLKSHIAMKAISVETNMAQIKGDAAAAAAAAWKAVAGIPFIGPALAPVAAGVAYAGVMGYGMLSAEGGFDIPAGMNPVTQLHEKEMVLPKAQADVIRGMADGGGSTQSKVELHVHATDAQSVARLFQNNGEHIVSALRKQQRNLAYAR